MFLNLVLAMSCKSRCASRSAPRQATDEHLVCPYKVGGGANHRASVEWSARQNSSCTSAEPSAWSRRRRVSGKRSDEAASAEPQQRPRRRNHSRSVWQPHVRALAKPLQYLIASPTATRTLHLCRPARSAAERDGSSEVDTQVLRLVHSSTAVPSPRWNACDPGRAKRNVRRGHQDGPASAGL